jgi:hypothetical protein
MKKSIDVCDLSLIIITEDVADVVMAADGLKSILKLASSQTLQVVRECARCLSNIASCGTFIVVSNTYWLTDI